jgi:YggT family protein
VIISLLLFVIWLYTLVVFARIIMSWIPLSPGSSLEPVYRTVFTITEPPLAAIRSVVPPLRLGMGALDLSPLILFVALQLLSAVLRGLF